MQQLPIRGMRVKRFRALAQLCATGGPRVLLQRLQPEMELDDHICPLVYQFVPSLDLDPRPCQREKIVV